VSLLDRVRHLLSAQNVAHAVIGAAALAIHGVSRATMDLDVLVVDRRVLMPTFWDPMGADVSVDIRVGDDDDPLAGVVRISLLSDRPVDVVVGRDRWQETVLANAVCVGTGQLPVAEPTDLILLKLYAGGSQDRWDIEQLLAIHSPGLVEAVDRRVSVLPARSRALWDALRASPQR
jgi:hypothetical protein